MGGLRVVEHDPRILEAGFGLDPMPDVVMPLHGDQ
jgi:hypothetical protein